MSTYIDLCCGIGSFHYAMQKVFPNSTCILACDISQPAKDTYFANYNIHPKDDLRAIEYPKADILFSGNPCQSFSLIGQQKGLEDERGDLFNYILDSVVQQVQPKFIVFENVANLVQHDSGKTFEYIKSKIEALGYHVYYKVLCCNDYGIPQNRQRVFIICTKQQAVIQWDKYKTKSPTLRDFINQPIQKPIAYTIRCGGRLSPIDSKQNWDGYITDNNEVYRLTIDDCKKLQGFPSDFKLCGTQTQQYTLLGNTIPTNLSIVICKILQELMISNLFDVQVEEYIEEYKNIIGVDTYEKAKDIYDKTISFRQSNLSKRGKMFEDQVYNFLKCNITGYNIFQQVSINKDGIIQNGHSNTVIDFVLSKDTDILNKSITDMIVISTKTTCKERYKQDNWTLSIKPKQYYLCCTSNDYPPSQSFQESQFRKIVTTKPKAKDDRLYKFSYYDLLQDIDNPKLITKVETNFDAMTVAQLKDYCRQHGIKGFSKLKKAELIDLCKQ